MYMVMHNAPLWTERDQPSLRLEDVRGDGRNLQYVSLASANTDAYGYDLADFINDYRIPLHEELRNVQDQTDEYMFGLGIDLRQLTHTASDVVGVNSYPEYRVVMSDVASQLPAYRQLEGGPFFHRDIHNANPVQVGSDFSPLMHVVRVCTECSAVADKTYVADAVAQSVGHALLSPYTDVWMTNAQSLRSSLPDKVTSGYVYCYDGREYGAFVQHAAAAKVGAETRRRMDIPGDDPALHPLLDGYSERLRRTPSAMAAIALEVVGAQLDAADKQCLWSDLYGMARCDTLAARRARAASMIGDATGGRLGLNELDRMRITTPQEAMCNLERTEEACGMEILDRPSTALKHASM